jgi:hypothetical protein
VTVVPTEFVAYAATKIGANDALAVIVFTFLAAP